MSSWFDLRWTSLVDPILRIYGELLEYLVLKLEFVAQTILAPWEP